MPLDISEIRGLVKEYHYDGDDCSDLDKRADYTTIYVRPKIGQKWPITKMALSGETTLQLYSSGRLVSEIRNITYNLGTEIANLGLDIAGSDKVYADLEKTIRH